MNGASFELFLEEILLYGLLVNLFRVRNHIPLHFGCLNIYFGCLNLYH